jgi:PGF-pre-PGF domain-containing protein
MKRIISGIVAIAIGLSLASAPVLADMIKPVVTEQAPKESPIPEYTPVEETDDEVVFSIEGKLDGDSMIFEVETDDAGSIVINPSEVCMFIDSIKIKSNEGVKFNIVFTKSESNPSKVDLEKSIGYCNVEVSDMDSKLIDEVEWNLKVNRKELNDQNLKNELMSLVKLENNKWSQIKTKKVDGNTESYMYVVSTDEVESGDYAFAEVKAGLFTLTNILICLGSLFGLIILGLIIAYAMQGKDEKKKSVK